MEIKWYWPAEQLGLVRDISHLYNDGYTYYNVSAHADEFFGDLALLLLPAMFILGLLIRFFVRRTGRTDAGGRVLRIICGLLLVYALLLAVGIGPYIIFYPQGSGFIDLSFIGHIIQGIYCALLALALFCGDRLGDLLARKK